MEYWIVTVTCHFMECSIPSFQFFILPFSPVCLLRDREHAVHHDRVSGEGAEVGIVAGLVGRELDDSALARVEQRRECAAVLLSRD